MIDILHLNHPLGKSETILTCENRDRYHAKTHNEGVIFKVNHLFGVFEDDGTDVFTKYNPNCRRKLKELEFTINKEKASDIYTRSKRQYKDSEIIVFETKYGHSYSYNNEPTVSIIVPTYNSFEFRKGSIELVLASLEMQTYRDYEVIIVDDCSTDQTEYFILDYVKKYEHSPFGLKYIKLLDYNGNRSKCRNIGVSEAKNNLLLFLDDDMIFLSDDSLTEIVGIYQPNHFLCGAKRFWSSVNWDRNLILCAIKTQNFELIRNKYILPFGINRRKGFRDLFEYSFLANCGLVSKTDFVNVGGFDETTFDGWGREDVDLMLRLYLNNVCFTNLCDEVSALHLNHPIKQVDAKRREFYFERYEENERRYGYIFKVNHLFGIFENDGIDILVPINRKGGDK